jgi:ubiquinone/menaquinone biosynthesis C-methylase UbiE
MLHAARRRAREAGLVVADATALPFRDAAADVTLAMHMLYHVPAPGHAVRELRRITRPGGRDPASVLRERISLDQGEALLRSAFESVTRHDFAGQLQVPGPEPVVAYVRSMRETSRLPDPEPLIEAVADRLRAAPRAVTTHSGCLISA